MFKRGERDARNNKKGQVTLFIIIAVVVVALGIVTWFLWPQFENIFMSEAEAQAFIAREGANLKSNVKKCVSSASEDIFKEMGMNAGYYAPGPAGVYTIDSAGPKVVIMYKDTTRTRVNKLLSLTGMADEYGKALELEGYSKIDSCLNDFADFRRNMEIEPGSRKITCEINSDNVLIHVDWPIQVTKAEASATLQQEDIELSIPLGRMWGFANDVVNNEIQQTNFEDVEDEYNWNFPEKREHLKLDTARGATHKQIAYTITTTPDWPGTPYAFYFAIDKG